jgi:hypothetical protein
MYYIIEALLVGTYSTLLYLLFSPFDIFNNIYFTLLVIGFFKHYLSYYIGIHTLFCRYGESCKKYNTYKLKENHFLVYESFIEAILYLLVGSILYNSITNNPIYIFFLIGFILHILFEHLYFHDKFCIERCTLNVIDN